MSLCYASSASRRTLLSTTAGRHRSTISFSSSSSSLLVKKQQQSISCRLLTSSSKNKLPPPLPPSSSSTSTSATISATTKLSPAKAKQQYIESQKRAGEFLKNPKASILRLQKEIDDTKSKLHQELDKSMWKRLTARLKTRQHSIINLLVATFAYILAHRLHLKMKANTELQNELNIERDQNLKLRSILRSITTHEFISDVVSNTIVSTTNDTAEQRSSSSSPLSWLKSWLLFGSKSKSTSTSTSTVLSEEDDDEESTTNQLLFVQTLRLKLEEKIGHEGLEENDKKQKIIEQIWIENEKEKLRSLLDLDLEELEESKKPPREEIDGRKMKKVDVEDDNDNDVGLLSELLTDALGTANVNQDNDNMTSSSSPLKKKRVFDM